MVIQRGIDRFILAQNRPVSADQSFCIFNCGPLFRPLRSRFGSEPDDIMVFTNAIQAIRITRSQKGDPAIARTARLLGVLGSLLTGICISGSAASASDPTIVFEPRPPYYTVSSAGEPCGLVAGPVAAALDKAGIAVDWKQAPSARQMKMVEVNKSAVCSPGWFKKPERLEFAKFSNTVYQDQAQVIVVRASDASRFGALDVDHILGDADLLRGAKKGYSYGAELDELIARFNPQTHAVSKSNEHLLRLLIRSRIDYFIGAPEEVGHLSEQNDGDISMLAIEGLPPGNKRYLMCSKSVGDETMERFNQALEDVRHGVE